MEGLRGSAGVCLAARLEIPSLWRARGVEADLFWHSFDTEAILGKTDGCKSLLCIGLWRQ